MFSMCGLLCRFLRGWRQNEAVGLMVHAASLKDASLLVENIICVSKNSSSLSEGENKSLFCQPFCIKVEEKHNQLLWRDNNKQAVLVSPKEKVDMVKWTIFLSNSPTNKDNSEEMLRTQTPNEDPLPHRITPLASRRNSTCSDCENIITVLLEASFRKEAEETLYGYNVLVEQLADPYAWKTSDVFGIIVHTTPTKLVTMIHAFFNNALIVDEDLCIRKIITVDLLGEPSSFENSPMLSESDTSIPRSSVTDFSTEMQIVKANFSVTPGVVTTYEAMKREGLRRNMETRANGSISFGPRPPSLLETKKLSSQSSEEDGSMDSDSGAVDINQLCPRGWAVSGLRQRSALVGKASQRVILGQPLSLNRERMRLYSHSEMETSFKHFQSAIFTSVIPNPLNEFFAVKEALNQKMQQERKNRQSKDNCRTVQVHKKGIDKFVTDSFTNPVFHYLPRFQKSFRPRTKAELGFSPKLYNREYILKQNYLESESFKRRYSIGKVSSPEPKVHIQPAKVRSEADLLKTTNIIKDNLANIIENYLTKSPRVVDPTCNIGTSIERKDPEVLLISDDKENSESILMVTVDEDDLKLNDLSRCGNTFDRGTYENIPQTFKISELISGAETVDEFASHQRVESFYLNNSKVNSDIPGIFNFNKNILNYTKEINLDPETLHQEIQPILSSFRSESEMKEKCDIENQESLDSDAAEHSFSEDSLNEKVSKGQSDESDTELVCSFAELNQRESFVSKSVRPKLAMINSKRISDFADLCQNSLPDTHSVPHDGEIGNEVSGIAFDKVGLANNDFYASLDTIPEPRNEISPLADSVQSLCNSASFEDNSFSEDSLLNAKFGDDKNPITFTEVKLESLVSTPEDFACRTDSLENLPKAEFPVHWHEEYVRIFSDANQDLRDCIHSATDLVPNTLEPIAEMDGASRDANINDFSIETEIDNKEWNATQSIELGKVRFKADEHVGKIEACHDAQIKELGKVKFKDDPYDDKCSDFTLKNTYNDLHPILEISPLKSEEEFESNKVLHFEKVCKEIPLSVDLEQDTNNIEEPKLDTEEDCRTTASLIVSVVIEQAVKELDEGINKRWSDKEMDEGINKRWSHKELDEGINKRWSHKETDFNNVPDFEPSKDKNEKSIVNSITTVSDPSCTAYPAQLRGYCKNNVETEAMSSPASEYSSNGAIIEDKFENLLWNKFNRYDDSIDAYHIPDFSENKTVENESTISDSQVDKDTLTGYNKEQHFEKTKAEFLSLGEIGECAPRFCDEVHQFTFSNSMANHSESYLENVLPLNTWDIFSEQYKNQISPTEAESLPNFDQGCVYESGETSGMNPETSPILRSGDDSFVFSQIAKAMLSPVDSASESGFASLKDSSHSEATSESGSGVPLSKSKDSLDMTDSERDRTSGVHTLLDELDALSSMTGNQIQTGSSPASMVSSARGSLMEDLVFGHSKELEVLDIENIKIPSVYTDNSMFTVTSSSPVLKRGKLLSVASLDSDHRSAGYKFLDRFHSSQRRVDLFDYSDLKSSKSGLQNSSSDVECTTNSTETPKVDMFGRENIENSRSVELQNISNEVITIEPVLGNCKAELEEGVHLVSKSASEDSSSQVIQTSDSISSSDTVISKTSFEDQAKLTKDQSFDEVDSFTLPENVCNGNRDEFASEYNNKNSSDLSLLAEDVINVDSSFMTVNILDANPTVTENLMTNYENSVKLAKVIRESKDQDSYQTVKTIKGSKYSENRHAKNMSKSPNHLSTLETLVNVNSVSSSKVNKQKPKSFEEVRKNNSIIKESKPLSKSLSGEANVLNGKIMLKHGFKHRKDIKSSSDSLHSLREGNNERFSSNILSDNMKSSSSERSTDSNHERSSSRTSSGSIEMSTDKVSLKSQDSLDKFSHFESICAQAKPRARRKKVLSVEVESSKREDVESIHRSATLPEGSFSKTKVERKKQKEERGAKKREPETVEKEKKSTLQSLKGFLKRNKPKDQKDKDTSSKKTSPSLFRKFEKKKGESSRSSDKKTRVISQPSPVLLHQEGMEESSRVEFPLDPPPSQHFNDKTHHATTGYVSTSRDGVTKMGLKSTLHRSNALASSTYIPCSDSDASNSSNRSTPNTSPLMRKSNLNESPLLYRKVLLRNVSSSQESVEISPKQTKKNLTPQNSPRRINETTSPLPLMGTKALLSSPKSFSVTIGFKPQVDGNSKTRTLSVGDNLHNISSSPITPTYRERRSVSTNLKKRSSSMEILVYGKIREHNPSRKRSSGGCSREGSFKLHREISVETLVEIPESFPPLEEGETENYQDYLQRVQESKDSRQSSTWSLCENEGSLSESMPLEKFSTHFMSNSHPRVHKKFSLPHNIHLAGPDEVSLSNPNLSRVGSALTRGMPLSSSFTSSPLKKPHSTTSSGMSPSKRGMSSHGKNSTSPGGDSCPASPLFEEEEEFECVRAENIEPRPPNILVYTANNQEYFASVKDTLLNTLSKDCYAVYHLTDEVAFKSPWKSRTILLVVCGDVPTHVSTIFIRYLLSGGQVLSICSDFLNVAVPLFAFKLPWTSSLVDSGTVEVQEAAVVSMSYNKWKNVQLLHHQHCFHSSPKHKRFSRDLEKRSTSSAVSVEPTFVEITDEYGVHHRLDLKVLAKDDTWGAPSLLVANVSENTGKALFSQVHLERDPNQSITCELKGEQLKKSNEFRLAILKDLLSTYLSLKTSTVENDEIKRVNADYSPAYMLGRHEIKQKFLEEVKDHLTDGRLDRHSLSVSFHKKEEQCSIPSESFLPILLTGYPKQFSTVKYFEELKTDAIGRLVIYCEVLTSTQNVVSGKVPLEHGIAVIAMQQKAGRGRYGNVWLSPFGCVMFSVQVHIPLASNMGQCLPFLQHLVALSMVTGVTSIPGYSNIPLRIKWPNDIYLGSHIKIGGLLVEAAIAGGKVVANIGCGVNLSNGNPTSCINNAIQEYNAIEKTKLSDLSREILCANIFNQMEKLLNQFQINGADDVINEYYKYWLHSNADVTVRNEIGQIQGATVVGVDRYGYLKAVTRAGEELVLHPDGNSFNMMEGLIYSKDTKNS